MIEAECGHGSALTPGIVETDVSRGSHEVW